MGWRRLRSARLSARARFTCLADEGGALDLSHLFTAGEEVTDTTFVVQKNGGLQQSSEVEESPGHRRAEPSCSGASSCSVQRKPFTHSIGGRLQIGPAWPGVPFCAGAIPPLR